MRVIKTKIVRDTLNKLMGPEWSLGPSKNLEFAIQMRPNQLKLKKMLKSLIYQNAKISRTHGKKW